MKPSPGNNTSRAPTRWHRLLGLIVLVPGVVLALTGILINHGDRLGLDRSHAQAQWLLQLYGITAPDTAWRVETARGEVSQIGDRLLVDGSELRAAGPVSGGRLVGALAIDDVLVIAVEYGLLLLDDQARLVESIPTGRLVNDASGARFEALGRAGNGRAALRSTDSIYLADAALLKWTPIESAADVRWSVPRPVEGAALESLQRIWRGQGPSWERVLLDLHSGRLFGPLGQWFMDFVALALVVMALTGGWLWLRRRPRNGRGGNGSMRAGRRD